MNEFIGYILESSLCIAVLTMFYYLVLRKETHFHLNRFYLLFSLIYALLVPLLNISYSFNDSNAIETGQFMVSALSNIESFKREAMQLDPVIVRASGSNLNISLTHFMTGIYLLVSGVILTVSALRFLHLSRIINRSKKEFDGKYYYLEVPGRSKQVYSFFHYIFFENENAGKEKDACSTVIEHEKKHADLYHSIDIILVEIIIVLQWFNPFVYLIRKMIIENHEFQVDSSIVNAYGDRENYLKLILDRVISNHSFRMVSNFSYSLTKKRLQMLTQIHKTRNIIKLKLLAFLPLAVGLFFILACSEESHKQVLKDTEKETIAFRHLDNKDTKNLISDSLIADYEKQIRENGESIILRLYKEFKSNEYPVSTVMLEKYKTYGVYLYVLGEEKGRCYVEIRDTTGEVAATTKKTFKHGKRKQHFYLDMNIPSGPYNLFVEDSNNKTNKVLVVLTQTTSIAGKKEESEDIYLKPDEMPLYDGDKAVVAFRQDLMQNIEYPEKAKKENIGGVVYVQFVINEEGELVDKEVVRGAHPLLDQAALDAFNDLPGWKPGKVDGKPVKTQFTVPVVFRLK